ncbi:MAG: hypothetical protein ACTSQB_07010, partial [Candidatus Heimdallarchaeota archaeon]
MFENIEKARQLLNTGSMRAAIDEYFRLIKILKEKKNYEEASRLIVEIATKVKETNDKRHMYHAAESFILEIPVLKIKDFKSFAKGVDSFFANVKTLYREKDEQYDKSGAIAEVQAEYYKLNKKDPTEFKLEAADDYSEWAARLLGKTRVREEDSKRADEFIKKAEKLYDESKHEEKIILVYNNIVHKQLENKNEALAEKTIDQAVDYLLRMKATEEKINQAAENVMNAYISLIEYKISEILNPEMQIIKTDIIKFDNNYATRIITHAKDICLSRKAKPAILILAKELALIGLAIFEKGHFEIAIPYYDTAKDYYLEVDNTTQAITFGESLISLGLQLYTDEKYPIGRDYFNIAIDIGKKLIVILKSKYIKNKRNYSSNMKNSNWL